MNYFITGTDTGVGKTIVTYCLGLLLQDQGHDVGVFKPVQCAGDDAKFLKEELRITDKLREINPYFAAEPLSPNVAFEREGIVFDRPHVLDVYQTLCERHDVMLIEGAGGVMVPITDDYLMIDLMVDLHALVIVVARLGLGTINHTLLTVEQLKARGLTVNGIVFSTLTSHDRGVVEETNPAVIARMSGVPVLGILPHLTDLSCDNVRKRARIDLSLNGCQPSRSLAKWDQQYIWHPFTQMKDWVNEDPLVIERAEGNYLIDTDGRRYLDGVSSLWVNVHGHRKREIDNAIKGQIDKLSHSTLLGLSNVPAIELAKKLVEITPEGLDKVFYSDNGSTAVEIGIKMAYQYWQNIGRTNKTKLVHLANSYHGDTLGSVSIGGIDLFHKVYRDLIFATIQLDFPDCYRLPDGRSYPEYAFECLDRFAAILEKRADEIAALVVEPIVQGAAGMIVWPEGILRRMADLCRAYDVLLIVDEVATGFGRTGKMFACEHEGVTPDIMCLAKGITGGYLPLAATLASQRIYDGFCAEYREMKTFFHGHTYSGNPLCAAAALANIDVFESERVLEQLAPKIKYLARGLDRFYNLSSVGDVRQFGVMVGIELVKDRITKEPFSLEDKVGISVCQRVREKGVILRPLGNVIVLMPPLSIAFAEIDQMLDALYFGVEQATGRYNTKSCFSV